VFDTLAVLIQIGRHLRLFTDKADVGMALNIEGLDGTLEKVYGRHHEDSGLNRPHLPKVEIIIPYHLMSKPCL
jgi:hypothetical protein